MNAPAIPPGLRRPLPAGFLQELADSPKLFMEWKGIEGQADDYIPVVKIAGKFDKVKNVDEFRYQFVLEFKLSNDFLSIRN